MTQFFGKQSERLDEAFRAVRRVDFVLPDEKEFADQDRPLPIGHGQTISQPTTVRMMLEWLDVQPGQTVLDVGSGSGWTTALLAQLVGSKGRIYAVDILAPHVKMGRQNCQKTGVKNAEFSLPDMAGGLVAHAPYDRILVSASARAVPESLKNQLAVGGKLVMPVGEDILEMIKTDSGWRTKRHPGFVFVPYIVET